MFLCLGPLAHARGGWAQGTANVGECPWACGPQNLMKATAPFPVVRRGTGRRLSTEWPGEGTGQHGRRPMRYLSHATGGSPRRGETTGEKYLHPRGGVGTRNRQWIGSFSACKLLIPNEAQFLGPLRGAVLRDSPARHCLLVALVLGVENAVPTPRAHLRGRVHGTAGESECNGPAARGDGFRRSGPAKAPNHGRSPTAWGQTSRRLDSEPSQCA